MRSYSTELMSYTGGSGRLHCVPAGYFPCHNTEEVLEEMAYNPEADTENTADSVFCSHGAGFVVPWYETERYMHLDAMVEDVEETAEPVTIKAPSNKNIKADEEELKAIFERTYGPVKTRLHDSTVTIKGKNDDEYVWKERKKKEKQGEYLLVDGYNIIFAWEELSQLARRDVVDARDRLIDILANYQGYTGKNIIIVFDAYKVKGFMGENLKWHNVDIVFTKEDETADQYIEKTAVAMSKKHRVTVATSDGTEQVIIRGSGCAILSATDLKAEIDDINKKISEEKSMKSGGLGNYVGDHIPR